MFLFQYKILYLNVFNLIHQAKCQLTSYQFLAERLRQRILKEPGPAATY